MSRRQTTLYQGALFNFLGCPIYRIDQVNFHKVNYNSWQESFWKMNILVNDHLLFGGEKLTKKSESKWIQMKG